MTRSTKLSRREFLRIAGIGAAGATLAACAPAAPQPAAPAPAEKPAEAQAEPTAAPAAPGAVALKFWVEWQQPFYEEFLKRFNEANTDLKLEFIIVEGLGGDSSGKFMASVAGGNPPDSLLAWADSLPGWAARQALEPMDQWLELYKFPKAEYAPASIEASTYNGKLYGWPLDWDPDCMLYWNVDMVQAAGLEKPPLTLEEFAPLREKFDKIAADGTIEQTTLTPWDGWYFNCFALAHQYGSKMYDAASRDVLIDSDGVRKAFQYEKEWADHYGFEKVSAFQSGISAATQNTAFGAGKNVFRMTGDWEIPGLKRNSPDLKYDIERLPIAAGGEYFHCGSGWPWMMPKGAKQPDKAALGISRMMMNRDLVLMWCQGIGWQPAWLTPRDDPSWAEVDEHWPKVFEIVKGFEASTWLEPSPIATAFWNEVKQAENMYLTGQQTLDEAITTAQRNVEKARDDAIAEGKF